MATNDIEPRWQSKKTLPARMLYLLEHDLMTDVTFVTGTSKSRISAHKAVLAAGSPVFYAMFAGALAETGDISIPDIEANVFTLILRYLYSDIADVNISNVEDVLYAAEKYDIEGLKDRCSTFLVEQLPSTPIVSFALADKYDLMELKNQSLKLIYESPYQYIGDGPEESFLKLRLEQLHQILESDDLCLKEIDVYYATVKWAKEQCQRQEIEMCDANIRQVLGLTLYVIRFPLMDQQVFCEEVASKEILTDKEKVEVFMCLSKIELSATKFNITARKSGRTIVQERVKEQECGVCIQCGGFERPVECEGSEWEQGYLSYCEFCGSPVNHQGYTFQAAVQGLPRTNYYN